MSKAFKDARLLSRSAIRGEDSRRTKTEKRPGRTRSKRYIRGRFQISKRRFVSGERARGPGFFSSSLKEAFALLPLRPLFSRFTYVKAKLQGAGVHGRGRRARLGLLPIHRARGAFDGFSPFVSLSARASRFTLASLSRVQP